MNLRDTRPPVGMRRPALLTCHLTKLETALEQVRKAFPKLLPTDAAMLASALSLTGRHAVALYDGQEYRWPEDYNKLADAVASEVSMAVENAEPVKKKASAEEEPILISVGLKPNYSAGEALLADRKDLQQALSDVLEAKPEFMYTAATDIGWQWALERANWNTLTGSDLARKVKVRTSFTEGAVGVEMGTGSARKRSSKAAKAEPAPTEEE